MRVYVLIREWRGAKTTDGQDITEVVDVFSSVSAACRATEFPEELWEKGDYVDLVSPTDGEEGYSRYWYEIWGTFIKE